MRPPRRYCLDLRTANDHFPGIGRYAVGLFEALAPLLEAGEELLVLRDPTRPTLFTLPDETWPGVSWLDITVSPFSPAQQWVLPRLLRRRGVALYHSLYLLMPLWPGMPAVLTVYDLIPLKFPGQSTLKARLLFRFALWAALGAARAVTTTSEASLRDLAVFRPGVEAKTRVVIAGVSPTFTPPEPGVVEDVLSRLGIARPYVLYLGSNKPHKNLGRLLEAWDTVDPHGRSLVLAGVTPEAAPPGVASASDAQPGAVRVLGRVDEGDLPALYAGADLFVFPSLYEGFGLPVLEALACGAAVACSRSSSLPEVAGEAAAYFDPTDVGDMARAIQTLLADDTRREALRSQAQERAARFTWAAAARETLALYRELVAP